MEPERPGIPEEPREWPDDERLIVGATAYGRAYVPDWTYTRSREPDEVAQTIERIYRSRQRRSAREVIPYSEPRAPSAEELLDLPPDVSMSRDEFLDACYRRSSYVACRKVVTVERSRARRAGL